MKFYSYISPIYKRIIRKPQNLLQALTKIGGMLAIFKIATFFLALIHQYRFERILQESIASVNDKSIIIKTGGQMINSSSTAINEPTISPD